MTEAPEDEREGGDSRPSATRRRGAEGADGARAHIRAARNEFEAHVAHARDQLEEANARIEQRTGRNLVLAILIGVVVGGAVLVALIAAKWVFLLIAIAIAVLGTFELTRALQNGGRRIDVVPQLTGAALLVLLGYFLDVWVLFALLGTVVVLTVVWRLIAQMIADDGRSAADVFADVVVSAFVQIYVPFLASLAMVLLRQERGEWWVLAFLIVVVAADTGAYATGLTLGRHPMAPRVSPKKTWEGLAGALAAAVLAGLLLAWLMLGLPMWTGLLIGPLLLLTATLGDLGESMLKRDLGVKDMSSWLPGHGGVLDRLDSILPSAPAALALFVVLSPLGAS